MPVTSLRKPFVRPPEVAKIKIKIKSQIKSQVKSESKSTREIKFCLIKRPWEWRVSGR